MGTENLPALLIVDDNGKNLYSTKKVLGELDINIHTASSGEAALREIVNQEFFLVLMEVHMPGMNGIETSSLIRGNENHKDVPIIFLTATVREDAFVQAGYGTGAVDFLFTPIDSHILLSKTRVFLEAYLIRKELERKNQELKIYDHMVAHDLKGPLSNIREMARLLKKKMAGKTEEDERYRFDRIIDNSVRAIEMIDSLLAFSEADSTDDLKEVISLRECIDGAVSNLKLVILEKNATLQLSGLEKRIDCVPVKVQQLFQNLISNALKYQLTDNRPEIKIFSVPADDPDFLNIIVEDNGIGFPQEQCVAIFSPFARLHGRSEYEGSGIGLATCKRIAEFHGWKIRTESEEGKGSRFIVSISI